MKKILLSTLLLSIVIITGCRQEENAYQPPEQSEIPLKVAQDNELPTPPPRENVAAPLVSQVTQTPPTVASKTDAPPLLPEADSPPWPPKVDKAPQQTPPGAVTMFAEALAEIDKEKYMAVIHGEPHIRKVAELTFDKSAAMKEYEKAFITAYGLEEWKKLALVDFNIDPETLHRKLESMQTEINGDQAVCTIPGDEKPVLLIKKDGLWYVNVSAMSNYGPQQADQYLQTVTKQIELIKEVQKKIGQPDVTALDLHQELSWKWMQIK